MHLFWVIAGWVAAYLVSALLIGSALYVFEPKFMKDRNGDFTDNDAIIVGAIWPLALVIVVVWPLVIKPLKALPDFYVHRIVKPLKAKHKAHVWKKKNDAAFRTNQRAG